MKQEELLIELINLMLKIINNQYEIIQLLKFNSSKKKVINNK